LDRLAHNQENETMQVTVIFDPALLKSQQTLAEAIYRLQIQKENFFFSRMWSDLLPAASDAEPASSELYYDGLLRPPAIDFVDFEDEGDKTTPILFISAAPDAGKVEIFVSVLDEQGNVVERGPAIYIPGSGTEWAFTILEPVESGRPVQVSVHVFDCVGGVRVEHHALTIP
jgi:hypothetical protein